MLSSDELGEKGESRFRELCADASLICNQSTRDRTGWDFIVEFEPSENSGASLDVREVPLSCHVQVKTVGAETRSFKVRLNMAERLAKEVKPAFFYVLKVDDRLNFVEAYLIHVTEDRLATILKRLRKHTAQNPTGLLLNKVFLHFTPRESEKIRLTGASLREALILSCGAGMHQYSDNKRSQLNRLGFGEKSYRGRVRFNVKSARELGDIYLGIKKNVPVTKFEVSETRFNIELKKLMARDGLMTIQLEPTRRGRLIARADDGGLPVAFNAEMYMVPSHLIGGATRSLVKTKFLDINFITNEEGQISAEFTASNDDEFLTVGFWKDYLRLLQILGGETGFVEIRAENAAGLMRLPIRDCKPTETAAPVDRWLALVTAFEGVLAHAGLDDLNTFSFQQLAKAESQIALVSELISEPTRTIEIPIDEAYLLPDSVSVVLCNRVPLGASTLAYRFVAQLTTERSGAGGRVIVSQAVFREARWIGQAEQDFAEYAHHAKLFERLEYVCCPVVNARFAPEE